MHEITPSAAILCSLRQMDEVKGCLEALLNAFNYGWFGEERKRGLEE